MNRWPCHSLLLPWWASESSYLWSHGSSLCSADGGRNKQINCLVYAEVSSDVLVQTKSRVWFQDSSIHGWSSKIGVSGNPLSGKSERALVALFGHLLCMDKEVAWITQTHVHLWMASLGGYEPERSEIRRCWGGLGESHVYGPMGIDTKCRDLCITH